MRLPKDYGNVAQRWSYSPSSYRRVAGENRQEIDNKIREYGEAAAWARLVRQTFIQTLDEIMGRLQFRTSYGQKCLYVIRLSKLVSWRANPEKCGSARRAGFLHDNKELTARLKPR